FMHDRVQQAAHDLIPQSELAPFRLEIGRRLLAVMSSEEIDASPFDLADNLNHGWDSEGRRDLLTAEEKLALANINLKAGRRARESLAHRSALAYLRFGIELVEPGGWQQHHALTFDLHTEFFECAY